MLDGLFINADRANSQCSMHEYGSTIAKALSLSRWNNYSYIDIHDELDVPTYINSYDFVIFNYNHITMRNLSQSLFDFIRIPKICLYLDVQYNYWNFPCHVGNPSEIFDYLAIPDENIGKDDPKVWNFSRTILRTAYKDRKPNLENPIISTFGLHTTNKTLDIMAMAINNEFDTATFRINFPLGSFVAPSMNDLSIINSLNLKPGINIQISHNFMSQMKLIDWLNESDLNIFFYGPERDRTDYRNMPSTLDQAIAAKRPIAVSNSRCVDYFTRYQKPYPEMSLREIMKTGTEPVLSMYENWSLRNFVDKMDVYLLKWN